MVNNNTTNELIKLAEQINVSNVYKKDYEIMKNAINDGKYNLAYTKLVDIEKGKSPDEINENLVELKKKLEKEKEAQNLQAGGGSKRHSSRKSHRKRKTSSKRRKSHRKRKTSSQRKGKYPKRK